MLPLNSIKDPIAKSIAFAHEVHIGHRRKYTGEPYTYHLAAVANLVQEVSGTPEMVAAAWLHDTVEDTPTTIEDVKMQFGIEIAGLVQDLTDVSKPGDGNRKVRKEIDRAHLADASPAAKTIKLADLIDNSESITRYDSKFAVVYMLEKKLLLEVLREGSPRLHARASEIIRRYYAAWMDEVN
jgi:(p)ppGpp synthase/HD superfamily hydrolase